MINLNQQSILVLILNTIDTIVNILDVIIILVGTLIALVISETITHVITEIFKTEHPFLTKYIILLFLLIINLGLNLLISVRIYDTLVLYLGVAVMLSLFDLFDYLVMRFKKFKNQ
jgi:hypothetical protein